MVHHRSPSETKLIASHRAPPRRRANPMGLGRLLIMVLTVGMISLGHGVFWWAGLILLTLILLAVGRQGHALWGTWSALAMMLALAFWHLHVIPVWTGLAFLAIGAIQFVLSLLPSNR